MKSAYDETNQRSRIVVIVIKGLPSNHGVISRLVQTRLQALIHNLGMVTSGDRDPSIQQHFATHHFLVNQGF